MSFITIIEKYRKITNDLNDAEKEHNYLRYILNLLLSIIKPSVQTVDIVENLPKVNFV